MIMRKVFPCCTVRAVIFTHSTPGALAEIRPPAFPVLLTLGRFLQPDFFLRHATAPYTYFLSTSCPANVWIHQDTKGSKMIVSPGFLLRHSRQDKASAPSKPCTLVTKLLTMCL